MVHTVRQKTVAAELTPFEAGARVSRKMASSGNFLACDPFLTLKGGEPIKKPKPRLLKQRRRRQ